MSRSTERIRLNTHSRPHSSVWHTVNAQHMLLIILLLLYTSFERRSFPHLQSNAFQILIYFTVFCGQFKENHLYFPKATVFPVVMYGCESWSVKKAERRRINAFKLWCWRRLLRVPWTARIETAQTC